MLTICLELSGTAISHLWFLTTAVGISRIYSSCATAQSQCHEVHRATILLSLTTCEGHNTYRSLVKCTISLNHYRLMWWVWLAIKMD